MTSVTDILLLVAAAAFAFASGVNDGGALVATGLAVPGVRVWAAILILVVAVVVTPGLLTAAVARTLGEDLVNFGDSAGDLALLMAVAATLAVVWSLSHRGLPTSLTLGLVGALTGAGIGAGLPVNVAVVVRVLLLAAAAPVLAALLAVLLGLLARMVPQSGSLTTELSRAHQGAFAAQCLAYGLNDGQKLLAVTALAVGLDVGLASRSPGPLLIIGLAFAMGSIIGVHRVAGTVGSELVPMRPLRAVVTELSSAIAVMGTGIAGAPVSMTQSIIGGLVGAGVTSGSGRVRWWSVSRVGLAWFLTLPLSFAVAAGLAMTGTMWR